jgi:AraC-like DNA-binding protein
MKEKHSPEFEWINQQQDTSIRYLEHGYPHELVRWHYHEEYELHFIKESSGKVFIGDYIGNFSANSLILVGPNLPHNWISDIKKGEQIALRDCVINFSEETVNNLATVFPEALDLAPFWQRAKHGIEFDLGEQSDAVIDLINQISKTNGFNRLSLFLNVLAILSSLSNYRVLSSTNYVPIKDERYLESLNKVITYIMDNYDAQISQEEVGQYVQMNPSYFSKFFKKATGIRFVEFVNGLRINKACELLTHTNTPITEICFSVGFNNIANFNRRFIDFKQMRPSEYRKTSALDYY